jgi:hypothetical protein
MNTTKKKNDARETNGNQQEGINGSREARCCCRMVQMDAEPTLHDASGDLLPILMAAFMDINLGQDPICIWVFTANITDELILELDIMHAHDAAVEFRRHVLQLGDEV